MTSSNFFQRVGTFARDRTGSVGIIFSLSFIPLIFMVGVGVDYGRAIALGAKTQAAVDAANLSSVAFADGDRQAFITNAVNAAFAGSDATVAAPTFATDAATGGYQVSVTASIPTTIMSMVMPTLSVTKRSTVVTGNAGTAGTAGSTDSSCIFTTGEMLALSTDVMTFNGAPSVQLTNCNIRSNKSIACNGGNIGANQAYAVGSIDGSCTSDPALYAHSGQPALPDTYSSIANNNLGFQCGNAFAGVTWATSSAGALPTGSNVKTVSRDGYREIHICGNLTLTGVSGSLTGDAPDQDTVIIIENGGLDMTTPNVDVKASRVTFVLASGLSNNSNNYPIVYWPSGNGNTSTLRVSSSSSPGNPWAGMAIYQNPSLTFNSISDNSWKPGASLYFDGVLYMPNARLTVAGNIFFGASGCTKIVAGEFTLNGNVNLRQSSAACASQGVSQYVWSGSPAAPATSTRVVN